MEEKYYLIDNKTVGKKCSEGYFLFIDGKWKADSKHLIRDCLIGYDASEPSDSPYCIGNSDMMDRIESITEEEAKNQILSGGKK